MAVSSISGGERRTYLRVSMETAERVLGLYRDTYFDLKHFGISTKSWEKSMRSNSATAGSSRRCNGPYEAHTLDQLAPPVIVPVTSGEIRAMKEAQPETVSRLDDGQLFDELGIEINAHSGTGGDRNGAVLYDELR
jgi:hypothetical protein